MTNDRMAKGGGSQGTVRLDYARPARGWAAIRVLCATGRAALVGIMILLVIALFVMWLTPPTDGAAWVASEQFSYCAIPSIVVAGIEAIWVGAYRLLDYRRWEGRVR